MATIKLLLKDNKEDLNGEKPIYLRIIKGRKAKFISTGYKVHPDLWDQSKQRVKKAYPNSARVNAFLAKKVAEAEGIAVTLETSSKYVSSKKIKTRIMGGEHESIIKYIGKYLDDLNSKNKVGTYRRVKAVLEKLKEYVNNKDLMFDEMDVEFLKRYEKYLRTEKNNQTNTINANFKIFRKVFNDAVREGLIEIQLDPFLKYRMTTEKTKREYLTEEEVNAIDSLDLPEDSPSHHHKNMYVFACYAGGIRISDLLQLKWKNFDGSHINLTTQKTKEPLRVKLPARALEIINSYFRKLPEHRNSDYIFPFLKNGERYTPESLFNAISSNTAYANKNLKDIAKAAKIDKTGISFHTSRHSFATIALRKGMRIEYLSRLMSHQSIKVTQLYAKIVNEELDNAMDIFNVSKSTDNVQQ